MVTVAYITSSSCQTIVTLTSDINKVMGALYKLEPDGNVKLHTGLSIARVGLEIHHFSPLCNILFY